MRNSFNEREKRPKKSYAHQGATLFGTKEIASAQELPVPSITKRIEAFLASAAENEQHKLLSSDSEDLTKTTAKRGADGKKVAFVSSHQQPSSCPYPSAAEERDRVCMKSPSDVAGESQMTYDLSKQELQDFVASWRGFIQKSSVSDVLMQMLADGRKSEKNRRRLARLFKEYPAIGILNIAVMSIKAGHWNSLYDAFEEAANTNVMETKGINVIEAVDRMEIAPVEPHMSMLTENDSSTEHASSFADVLNKSSLMLETLLEELRSDSECLIEEPNEDDSEGVLKKLMNCLKFLLENLVSIVLNSKARESNNFIQLYFDKLLRILKKFQQKTFENGMDMTLPESRIKMFLNQLAIATEKFERFSEDFISKLLSEQFQRQNSKWCSNIVRNHLKTPLDMTSSRSLFYSRALLATRKETLGQVERNGGRRSLARVGNLTSLNAKHCLLKAPMLCNISEWSQWGTIFAPTLGPLLDWLEQENLSEELVFLVTCQGSIIRIDGSATVDSLLTVAVRGLGKETALHLISLVAKYGGADRVPKALLKSYLSKAMEVLLENGKAASRKRKELFDVQENRTKRTKILPVDDAYFISRNESNIKSVIDTPVDKFSQVVEFILDLFMHLPSEFVEYASHLVVPALCRIVPNAPIIMLNFCSGYEHMIRLYEVGVASGITEWVKDFQILFAEPCKPVKKEITDGHLSRSPVCSESDPSSDVCMESTKQKTVTGSDITSFSTMRDSVQKTSKEFPKVVSKNKELLTEMQESEAQQVISRIRKEEFGMDLELTSKEMILLSKQHARMGRALQRLSHELYSQDSHFVLELVQNADDNQYETDVSPILLFILQQERVVVVNNELGFTPANMTALCDVGNSTKTGSASGYIGQKGIGFKSVFRITDTPEIHSRGFHVKFDISEGSIGFILPTVILPFGDWHEIEEAMPLLGSLTGYGKQTWNTCMVLPLKHAFVHGPDIQILSTKFCDIRPSLLLFLRRLCCIAIKDDVRSTMRVMRRYNMNDGLVRISDNESVSYWLVVKQELDACMDCPRAKTTEIALAFPLQEVSPGELEACDEYQEVFSFLPLRSYCLRFIIQGDFVLPSSREDLDTDSPWNQWLLLEIPGVCVKALESFKRLPRFNNKAEKAASIFLSFLPHEGEVPGFFSALPRMIFASLRTSSCLPVDGGNREWLLPCMLLGGWDESVKNLLSEELLWDFLGLRYLHKGVHLTSILASELGVRLYGSQVLLDFLEHLSSRQDVLRALGARWVSSWLIALDNCLLSESHARLISDSADRVFKRLQVLPFIPLSNGTYASLEEGPLWLPSFDLASEAGNTGLLRQFPILYADMRMVDEQLLCPDSMDSQLIKPLEEAVLAVGSEERIHLFSILKRLGICQISEHKVVTLHALPTVSLEHTKNSAESLIMECLAFIMVHFQSDCNNCKTERASILDELRKKAYVVSNEGLKRMNEMPVHFGVEFGCPADVNRLLQGLQIPWIEVDPLYLQTFKGWSKELTICKWRDFFKELGVTDFVKLEFVEKTLHDKSASIWKDISWEGFDCGSQTIHMRDWACPEAVLILENLCNMDFSERALKCAQFVSLLDLMWEESYCDHLATYWGCLSPDSLLKRTTIPSFILSLRSFSWIQSSFDGKLYQPNELFHQCSAVEALLGDNAPYCRPQLKSTKLAAALGLHMLVTVPLLLRVVKLWSQVSVYTSVEQMTKLYTWLWNEMGEDSSIEQFLQTESSIFVPDIPSKKQNGLVVGRFMCPKNLVWRDETGSLSFILSKGIHLKEGLLYRTLDVLYPTLQPFLMGKCFVRVTLSFKEYHNILRMVSMNFHPRKALDKVLRVFAMWSDNIESGQIGTTDLSEWREQFQKSDSKVFPTVQNSWVSLHSDDGILCWCDDEVLGNIFLGAKGVHYLCIDMAASDASSQRDSKTISVKMLGPFLQAMNILPLSKVVVREAIPQDAQRSQYLMELCNWALPYVQRYLQKLHPNVYNRLQRGVINERLNRLSCLVCNRLFFRYKLYGETCTTSERLECNYLLEGDVFYAAEMDDLNGLFLEFSKLFFEGSSNSHLANLLHLITLSVQSGSDEKEIEALLATQGIDSFQENDKKWALCFSNPNILSKSTKIAETYIADVAVGKPKRFFADNWPPRTLQDARKSNNRRALHAHKLHECQRSFDAVMKEIESKTGRKPQRGVTEAGSGNKQTAGVESESQWGGVASTVLSAVNTGGGRASFLEREQLAIGQPNEQHQELTGRLGEAVVYNHLLEKHGPGVVKWVNAEAESGLPYDIVLGVDDGQRQQKLVEVKATWAEGKDWFEMSPHEWELACRLGDRFVIVRVFLTAGGSSARFLWLPNPSQLCQQRLLKLALLLPHQNPHPST